MQSTEFGNNQDLQTPAGDIYSPTPDAVGHQSPAGNNYSPIYSPNLSPREHTKW